MPIAASLLPEFDHEMAGLRRVLERVPDDRFAFKPHPKSWSLGELANHLSNIPRWATATFLTSGLDFASPEARVWTPPQVSTRKELLEILDRGVAEARTALAEASDAAFGETWTGSQAGQVLFAMPRITTLRGFVMNHMIHHRAQLTVYLRLLDLPVPSLYGPSADEG